MILLTYTKNNLKTIVCSLDIFQDYVFKAWALCSCFLAMCFIRAFESEVGISHVLLSDIVRKVSEVKTPPLQTKMFAMEFITGNNKTSCFFIQAAIECVYTGWLKS